ncbi:hypothetical protein [Frankia sp. EAN1pec]|uniref:hypothetical protein n=1 Tax=Parafrankia sp. (strain EAN1pec) TaxID=298653 RepID=UPI0018DEBB28
MARLAMEKGITPAQLALAWVLARGEDIVAILAPVAAAIWSRTSPPRISCSPRTTWPTWTARRGAARHGASAGDRYYSEMMKTAGC